MIRNIIINKEHRETRVATVEDGKLVEILIERDKQLVGSIYKCKVDSIINGIDAAFVNIGEERNAFLYAGDILSEDFEDLDNNKQQGKKSIDNLLKEGEELMVQVVKAPRGTKGARVSTKISIPGRYLILIPHSKMIGASKKIDATERKRLKQILTKIKPKNFGIIVRSEAENISQKDLEHDINLMLKLYKDIEERAKSLHAPALVYKELSIIYQTVRDNLNKDINNLYVDSEVDYKKAIDIINFFDPKLKSKIKFYKDKQPIFEHFGIEYQFKQLFKRKVWIKGGGNICIDHAEAMTVIDVNSGKNVNNKNLEETVFQTNIAAAKEIARQIRLRDIGGIIIIDFIDMKTPKYKQELLKTLGDELKKEHTKTTISQISQLGLIELTRKRVTDAVSETVTEMCPYCNGRGKIESPETVSLRAERDIRSYLNQNECDYGIIVNMHPDSANYLIGEEGKNIGELEAIYATNIFVRGYEDRHIEDIKIIKIKKEMLPKLNPIELGQVYTITPIKSTNSYKDVAYTWINNVYVEIPYAAKYAGKQKKIIIKQLSRNVVKAKIKED